MNMSGDEREKVKGSAKVISQIGCFEGVDSVVHLATAQPLPVDHCKVGCSSSRQPPS